MQYIVTILLFLLFTVSVSAECAWILWSRIEVSPTHPPSEWVVEAASSKEEQCKKMLEEHTKKELDFYSRKGKTANRFTFTPGVESVVEELGKHAKLGVDVLFIKQYTCLPDTVKPKVSPLDKLR